MTENKTKQTEVSVIEFLDAVTDPVKRADSDRLIEIMSSVTGEPPKMWGPSIVGFGTYHYKYESGREGDMPITGFSPRKAAISLYLTCDWRDSGDVLGRLGKHKLGVSCLYIKRLSDVDETVLIELIERSAKRFV